MKLKLNGKEIDLSQALPLTFGDLEDLEDLGVIRGPDVEMSGPKAVNSTLLHLAQKIDPDITRDDIRTIPLDKQDVLGKWFQSKVFKTGDRKANPTS